VTMSKHSLLGSALGALSVVGLASCGGGGGSAAPAFVPTPVTVTPPPVPSTAPVISSAPQASVMESESGSFYTLEASDAEGDALTMTLLSTGDAGAFAFDASTGALSPAATTLDYEQPLDANEDLDYPLNSDGELTGQQQAPSERDLTGTNQSGEFVNPALGSTSGPNEPFSHPLYFHTGADGGLVMNAPVIGATTSSGVRFTRTEFREMLRRGDEDINTNTNSSSNGALQEHPNLNNWAFSSQPQNAQDEAGGVDGVLRVTMSVNAVTSTGRDNEIGRLIIGQIHARNDEPIRLYYRKLPGNTHGSIYACHELRDGDDITFNIIGSIDDNQPNPENGFLLGELFTYELVAEGNIITATIYQDGVNLGDAVIDMEALNSGYDIAADYMYFKAGLYHVNSTADPSEFAEVTLYELENSHEGYDF